jgi:hypothetical protein
MKGLFNKQKKRGEPGWLADYLNNFEERKRLSTKAKNYFIFFIFVTYLLLLYNFFSGKIKAYMTEKPTVEVPCHINVMMAKDSLHMHYTRIIDSITAAPPAKSRGKRK